MIGIEMVKTIAQLTALIAADESLTDQRLERGRLLLEMGDTKGAADDCQWLLEHVEPCAELLLFAARLASAKGKTDEALDYYNKVIALNPQEVAAYQERGKIFYQKGYSRQAEEDLRKALELNPQQILKMSGDYQAEGIEHRPKRSYLKNV
jgi:tetratricopeptide (TPR) repeat protein